ncbi:MAG: hypothetical protein KDD34_01705, partial [Bdellovibrionales bacterium]|nr:hypothetical protein [Bdellovibrionales bacterium]
MKNIIKKSVIFGMLLSVIVLGCAQKETPEQKAENLSSWKVRMNRLSSTLADLMPMVVDAEKFNNPRNHARIKNDLLEFTKLSHDISMNKKPEADPSLDFVSRKFSTDMKDAYAQFEQGNASYARYMVQNTTNYCISCHTRTNEGRTNL